MQRLSTIAKNEICVNELKVKPSEAVHESRAQKSQTAIHPPTHTHTHMRTLLFMHEQTGHSRNLQRKESKRLRRTTDSSAVGNRGADDIKCPGLLPAPTPQWRQMDGWASKSVHGFNKHAFGMLSLGLRDVTVFGLNLNDWRETYWLKILSHVLNKSQEFKSTSTVSVFTVT